METVSELQISYADLVLLSVLAVIALLALYAIIKMICNRLNGRDELDGFL